MFTINPFPDVILNVFPVTESKYSTPPLIIPVDLKLIWSFFDNNWGDNVDSYPYALDNDGRIS